MDPGRTIRRSPDRASREIALTFDDGPAGSWPSRLLGHLAHERLSATVFVAGQHVEDHPDIVRRAVAEGDAVASHSFSHPMLAFLTDALSAEMNRTGRVIEDATGICPSLVRPPYGNWSPWFDTDEPAKGRSIALWSLAVGNDACSDDALVAHRVLGSARRGNIVLLHDGNGMDAHAGRVATVAAVPTIIDGLRQRGYAFVTVPDMFSARP